MRWLSGDAAARADASVDIDTGPDLAISAAVIGIPDASMGIGIIGLTNPWAPTDGSIPLRPFAKYLKFWPPLRLPT